MAPRRTRTSRWAREPVEFLTEVVLTAPPDMPPEELEALRLAEARRAAELADAGHLLRLWRPVDAEGWRNIGLWSARDLDELWALLESLPLRPLMTIEVRGLDPHPSDPAGFVASHSPAAYAEVAEVAHRA